MAGPHTTSTNLSSNYPKPTYEFFIPSIYDDTALACRIYSVPETHFGGRREPTPNPPSTDPEPSAAAEARLRVKPWTPRGAVFAHSCTWRGGNYDDHVILGIVRELVNVGCTVGTFNLRGAGKSKGRPSWDSKAELQDYITFVGFFMYYLHGVYPPVPGDRPFDDFYGLTPILSGVPATRPPANLVLGGYAYGALLTRYLPHVSDILARFSTALKTSTEAEVRLRAATLAAVTVIDILDFDQISSASESRSSKTKGSKAEDEAAVKRKHMASLQAPFVRKDDRFSWPGKEIGDLPEADDYISRVEVPSPKTHYMLISLLLGPVASAATGFQKLSATGIGRLDEKFIHNTSCVIHGEKDKVASVIKVRDWVSDIVDKSKGACQAIEIAGVGHSWRRKKAAAKLLSNVRIWVETFIGEDERR
ncbi:MAG: hypothetical protein Q9182_001182 [Xanthomendoza sp. 2 TL-2023]